MECSSDKNIDIINESRAKSKTREVWRKDLGSAAGKPSERRQTGDCSTQPLVTQSDYFNRRVFTETADNQPDDFEMDRAIGKFGLNFSKGRGGQRPSGNTHKPDKHLLSGGKDRNILHSMALELPKTNVVISTNNIHQNISIFTEDRQAPKKILLTEGSVKGVHHLLIQPRSKDRLIKRDSKKTFEKMRLRKDKKSTVVGHRDELRLNKSKDWKDKQEVGVRERHIKTQAAE